MSRARWVAALALAVAAALALAADTPSPSTPGSLVVLQSGRGQVERIPARGFEGETYVPARQVARLMGASLHWRADVRKLVLRNVKHTLKFTVDTRFAVLDENVVFQLSGPVRQEAGEVYLPLSALETVFSGRFVPQARLVRGGLVLVADEPDAGPPQRDVEPALTRLTLPTARPLEAGLVSARPGRFTVRIPGAHLTLLPGDTLGGFGLVEHVRFGREPEGLWLEARLAPAAQGYRLRSLADPHRIELEVAQEPLPQGFVTLGPDFGRGAREPLRVLVIDPGHGGADTGFVAGPEAREKDLTLTLALQLRDRLRARMPATEVVLTRSADLDLPAPARVELANRAHADLYLSLHFDADPGTGLAGLTAYVAPPLGLDPEMQLGGEDAGGPGRPHPRPVQLVSWERAAGRHHGEARGAADLLLASLAADGFGPTRLRIVPTYVTEGADCPAVLLECGSLSDPRERLALAAPEGLARLADSLARALERYSSGAAWP